MNKINILNKKISYKYNLYDEYIAGIQLLGTEIKSIRQYKVSITESYCQIKNEELYIINMHISEYKFGTYLNHEPKRERKLLLQKKELLRLKRKLKNTGMTIIPYKLFLNKKGFAKLQIFLAKGKKIYDKRKFIQEKEFKRNIY
ncbi:MAG: SsrA-binding protein SmpB [Candidatus Bostrichicola ureolyticus]|nr:MAG: SsrA-binding protein SmpB [Candidatus Bostrichicola ureolyticus]WGH27781.1 MAG: SsrA-binding protein SmpB [Candidatus Bostrichicola ureolyticus]